MKKNNGENKQRENRTDFKEKVCDRVQMKIVTNYNNRLTPSFVYFLLDSLNGSF